MNTSSSLRSFRLVCKPDLVGLVENLLLQQGFRFAPESISLYTRKLLHEPFPLGSSIAAQFGYVYIQDKSSMLPPLVLAPQEGSAVLDVCASPGSKTSFLGQLVGDSGFVLGNEPSQNRLATLRRNLIHLNMIHCATTSYSGEMLPLPPNHAGWDYIQLDPPCSGWGTVEKNPQVLSLWQGDKVKPLIALQRQLLTHAYDMLAPGGKLVYSTCTTNIEENEEQLAFACDSVGYLFESVTPPEGIVVEDSLISRFAGCLRIATSQDAQGFFVAVLRKPTTINSYSAACDCREPSAVDAVTVAEKDNRKLGKERFNKKKAQKQTSWKDSPRLGRHILMGDFIIPEALPEGELAVFNDVVHFLPQAALRLIPDVMNWKGFPLGKMGPDGGLRVSSSLRHFMPSLEQAEKLHLPLLALEDPAPLQALLSGQSITVSAKSSMMGLYYQGLPLCMLTVKGSRAILTNK